MRRVSGCALRTQYFVNSGEVASDDVSSGALSSDAFLQTHFFRRSKLQ